MLFQVALDSVDVSLLLRRFLLHFLHDVRDLLDRHLILVFRVLHLLFSVVLVEDHLLDRVFHHSPHGYQVVEGLVSCRGYSSPGDVGRSRHTTDVET